MLRVVDGGAEPTVKVTFQLEEPGLPRSDGGMSKWRSPEAGRRSVLEKQKEDQRG